MSVLKALESLQDGGRYDLVIEVLHLVNTAILRESVIELCWIPTHVCIGGNEAYDLAVKEALKIDNATQIPLGPSEIVSLVK